MPQISKKGLDLPQSAIRKLVPFADAAKERGVHVYHLNIGQPDIETPKGALKVLAETAKELPASHGVLEYSHSAGIPSYRRALCNYYHRHGIDVTPNQVLVTTGGSEALQMAFTVCLNPGDEIIIPEPYYTNYNTFAKEGHHAAHQGHHDLQPQQPDGLSLYPRGTAEGGRIGQEIRPVSLCRRGVSRVLLRWP